MSGDIEKDILRYERVREKADEMRDELATRLAKLFEAYAKVKSDRPHYDRFPQCVEEIDICSGRVRIRGTSSSRGCTDHEGCSMPLEYVAGTPAEQEQYLANIRAANTRTQQRDKTAEIARTRAKLERLEKEAAS